jgi:hypothetical protein
MVPILSSWSDLCVGDRMVIADPRIRASQAIRLLLVVVGFGLEFSGILLQGIGMMLVFAGFGIAAIGSVIET